MRATLAAAGLSLALLMMLGHRLAGTAVVPDEVPEPRRLLYARWPGNALPTPAYIQTNASYFQTLPFDGIAVYLAGSADVTASVMTSQPVPASTIEAVLAPLQGLTLGTLQHNFAYVLGTGPPDFFDDWSVPLQNFANAAAGLKNAGLRGILFDNEQYWALWAAYPAGVKYAQTKTLADYQAQARLRGQQVMQAMLGQYPDIAVLSFHGPYVSEPAAPVALGFPTVVPENALLGPFYVGFTEAAADANRRAVEGGELYSLRAPMEFFNSYVWRKTTFASDSVDCAFLPAALRPLWSGATSIAFGVYDQPFGGLPMDPATLRATLIHALQHADEFVWLYSEGENFLLPESEGGASLAWRQAVEQARAVGASGPAVVPAEGLESTGPAGGPFSPPGRSYTVLNARDTPLPWSASADVSWLSLSATGGVLPANGMTSVVVTIDADARLLAPGNHDGTISFTSPDLGATSREFALGVSAVLEPGPPGAPSRRACGALGLEVLAALLLAGGRRRRPP